MLIFLFPMLVLNLDYPWWRTLHMPDDLPYAGAGLWTGYLTLNLSHWFLMPPLMLTMPAFEFSLPNLMLLETLYMLV